MPSNDPSIVTDASALKSAAKSLVSMANTTSAASILASMPVPMSTFPIVVTSGASIMGIDDTESDDDSGNDDVDHDDDEHSDSSDEDDDADADVRLHSQNVKKDNSIDSDSDSDSDDCTDSITPTLPPQTCFRVTVCKKTNPLVASSTGNMEQCASATMGASSTALPLPAMGAVSASNAHSLHVHEKSEKKRKTQEAADDFDETTFASLMCAGTENNIIFHQEIRQHAKMAGMDRMSNEVLEKYVFKIFGLKAYKPSKDVKGKRKQARGYKNLCLVRPTNPPQHQVSSVFKVVKVAKLVQPLTSEQDGKSPAASSFVAAAQSPLLVAGTKSNDDAMSLWQTRVMALILESLGKATPATHTVDSSGNMGVGLVLSKNRRGEIVVGQITTCTDSVLCDFVSVGDYVRIVDGYIIDLGTTLEDVCNRLTGKPGSTVQIQLLGDDNSTGKNLIVQRNARFLGLPVTPIGNKIFFYGGSQEDRDKCIGRLQRNFDAYCILPMQSSALKIAELYSKRKVNTSIVVIEYEEVRETHGKMTKANEKIQKSALAVARCLTMGRFWHDIRGPASFTPPSHIFAFCNVQPKERLEWEGWIFHHISDSKA